MIMMRYLILSAVNGLLLMLLLLMLMLMLLILAVLLTTVRLAASDPAETT